MNFGFNSNVRVGGVLYHVQSEDRGSSHPFLDTVVYEGGKVVHRRSTSYANLTGGGLTGEALEQQLHELLGRQHREVIALLEAGTLELSILPSVLPESPARSSAAGLDVRLLNSNSWLASRNATLEIAVRRADSGEVARAEVEAFLEDGQSRSKPCRARTDQEGHALLKFALPPSVSDGAVLVIRAAEEEDRGELRFRLKPRRHDAVPSKETVRSDPE